MVGDRPRLGSSSSINRGGTDLAQTQFRTIQMTDSDGLGKTRQAPKVTVEDAKKPSPSSFENYIGRVITSVQHRKKNPRLKSLFGG